MILLYDLCPYKLYELVDNRQQISISFFQSTSHITHHTSHIQMMRAVGNSRQDRASALSCVGNALLALQRTNAFQRVCNAPSALRI